MEKLTKWSLEIFCALKKKIHPRPVGGTTGTRGHFFLAKFCREHFRLPGVSIPALASSGGKSYVPSDPVGDAWLGGGKGQSG